VQGFAKSQATKYFTKDIPRKYKIQNMALGLFIVYALNKENNRKEIKDQQGKTCQT
jgi:hypothetical protein